MGPGGDLNAQEFTAALRRRPQLLVFACKTNDAGGNAYPTGVASEAEWRRRMMQGGHPEKPAPPPVQAKAHEDPVGRRPSDGFSDGGGPDFDSGANTLPPLQHDRRNLESILEQTVPDNRQQVTDPRYATE